MHKRYGFELIQNEPEMKIFSTKTNISDKSKECWVCLQKTEEELEMVFQAKTKLKNICYNNWFKNVYYKLKLCYDVLRGKEIYFEQDFNFRGRNHIDNFADMISLLSKNVLKETNQLDELMKQLSNTKNQGV